MPPVGAHDEQKLRITVANVLDAVCQGYGCSKKELRAPGKVRPFTEARAVASAIIQEIPHLSLTELGRELNRDIASLGRVGRRVKSEAVEDKQLCRLLKKVKKTAKRIAEGLA